MVQRQIFAPFFLLSAHGYRLYNRPGWQSSYVICEAVVASGSLTYERLRAAWTNNSFEPLYLFFGQETLLMSELQHLLIERALTPAERDFNLDILYGPEIDVGQAIVACSGFPMMAERRVVIIRDFDKMSDNRLFASYAERPNTSAVVVLVCGGKPNMSAHPYKALRQHATLVEFETPKPRHVPAWIEQRIKERDRTIEPRALHLLSESVTGSLSVAATEIDKLITYAGDRTTLSVDDVLAAGGYSRDCNVFELQRHLGDRDLTRAILVAERLLQQSTNATGESLRIQAVLRAFFQRLWKVGRAKRSGDSRDAIEQKTGVKGWLLGEYLGYLSNWPDFAIGQAFSALVAADFELKGGSSRNPHLVMLLMIRRMLSGQPMAQAA